MFIVQVRDQILIRKVELQIEAKIQKYVLRKYGTFLPSKIVKVYLNIHEFDVQTVKFERSGMFT